MSKINWRERGIAAAIHFAATAFVSACAAILVFSVWFPDALSDLVGGKALFLIMTGCDVVLGPLLSLVIYSSAKPKKELVIDYTVIAVLQFLALGYGVSTMAQSRPVFVAFDVRRIEIVSALELDDAELSAGIEPRFRERSLTGPKLVAIQRPFDGAERTKILNDELEGRGAFLSPKYYREYGTAKDEVRAAEETLDSLLTGSGDSEAAIRSAIAATGKSEQDLRWMMAHHRFGFGIALVDVQTHEPVRYIAIDPRWVR